METSEVPLEPTPKRKYKKRLICTDPDLKYKYKQKPGRKPGHSTKRKRFKPVRTDAEQRRFSRLSHALKKTFSDPVKAQARAKHLVEYNKKYPNAKSRLGIPDGMNKAQAQAAWAVARAQAEEVFTQMVDKGIVAAVSPDEFEQVLIEQDGKVTTVLVPKTDEAKASVALKEAMVMVLGPMGTQQTKLQAINTVLKFTKSPPATKVEVSKAEDLLALALKDINSEDGDK